MKPVWSRAIRFVATDGRTLFGEPILDSPDVDIGRVREGSPLKARVITGSDLYDESGVTQVTEEIVTVKRLLGPLRQQDVPILRCVGLNYMKHSNVVLITRNFRQKLTKMLQSVKLAERRHLFLLSSSNQALPSKIMTAP